MEQKEYPVGSRFQVNGQWYEVKPSVEGNRCSLCCFSDNGSTICKCPQEDCYDNCIGAFRKDNENVYFVKIDPPTDFLDVAPLTRPIGSYFYDRGVKLQVCDASNSDRLFPCFKYCHYHLEKCGDSMSIHGFCGIMTRTDRKNVYFKEVKDE